MNHFWTTAHVILINSSGSQIYLQVRAEFLSGDLQILKQQNKNALRVLLLWPGQDFLWRRADQTSNSISSLATLTSYNTQELSNRSNREYATATNARNTPAAYTPWTSSSPTKAGRPRAHLNQYPRLLKVVTPSRLTSVPNAEVLCIAPAQHSQDRRSSKLVF